MADYQRVTPDETYNYSARVPGLIVSSGLLVGFGYGVIKPLMKKLPKLRGTMIYMPQGLLVGGLVAYGVDMAMKKYNKIQMDFAEEYRARNPDDFVEPPKQTYGELLLPWSPTR